MKILVKLPSRGRPKKMIKALTRAIAKAEDNSKIHYLLTLDQDDPTTQGEVFDTIIKGFPASIQVERARSSSKIHACNRDMSKAPKEWDILLLLSDDMICQTKGWDTILRKEMQANYSDLDGVLWFNDGYIGEKLNTLCILGRKYFERFNYIYHPSYKSLWCDNEFMEVANKLNKQTYFEQILFKHEHPAWNGDIENDPLYRRNEAFYREDQKNYNRRKSRQFA